MRHDKRRLGEPRRGHLSAGLRRSNCVVDFSPNDETIVVDGYTFQYVTSRSDGSELLDLNNRASYLWTP